MRKPFLVFENAEAVHDRRLFRFLGVEWMATDRAWLSLILAFGLGLSLAVLVPFGEKPQGQVMSGAGLGVMLLMLHVTVTRHVNLYNGDQARYPTRVHFMRAIGGPVLTVVLGLASMGVWLWTGGNWPAILAVAYLSVGIASLAPIPGLDGSLVWGAVFKREG